MKGHDYWLRAPLRGYIKELSFSIVYHLIISYLFIFYILFTVLHGLLCYIPSILDNSCVSEPCSSHLVSEHIRELIAQNEELKIERQKMDQDLLERDEEILRLKNHNQNLLVKIRKLKDKQGNTNSEQENQGVKEKSTEKEEEISCLRNLNQKLLEQIKILKDKRKENLESEKDNR
jgi:hypothetical protein